MVKKPTRSNSEITNNLLTFALLPEKCQFIRGTVASSIVANITNSASVPNHWHCHFSANFIYAEHQYVSLFSHYSAICRKYSIYPAGRSSSISHAALSHRQSKGFRFELRKGVEGERASSPNPDTVSFATFQCIPSPTRVDRKTKSRRANHLVAFYSVWQMARPPTRV